MRLLTLLTASLLGCATLNSVMVHASDSIEQLTFVASRVETSVNDLTSTVNIIDSERLQRELVKDIKDVICFEPGVVVGGTGSRFGLDGFNIRGIGGNRVLTMIDGIRVPNEFSFGLFLSARRDFVDIDSVNRVEITSGPVSSAWGSDAVGGVVAFTTSSPSAVLGDDRFKISKDFCREFEQIWRERDSYLEQVAGFNSFNLLKSAEYEDFVLYASHFVFEDENAFTAWTESEEFRLADRQARAPKGIYVSHPELETFTGIL